MGKRGLNVNEYMYSSARIRALENGLIGQDKLNRLLEMQGPEAVMQALDGYGIRLNRESGEETREDLFLRILKDAYAEVDSMMPEGQDLSFLRLKYDCHNIKSVMKCYYRHVDPSSMIIPLGTLDVESLQKRMEQHDLENLEGPFAEAAAKADLEYASTQNPQVIDLILDRAYFESAAEAARAFGSDYLCRVVAARADLLNCMMTVRTIRMGQSEASRSLLDRALVPGGVLETSFFEEAFSAGEQALFEGLAKTDYYRFSKSALESDLTLATLERLADNAVMEAVREAKFISFGPEVSIAYLEGMETAVKNMRILLAGKDSGLSVESIRERLRDSYV